MRSSIPALQQASADGRDELKVKGKEYREGKGGIRGVGWGGVKERKVREGKRDSSGASELKIF